MSPIGYAFDHLDLVVEAEDILAALRGGEVCANDIGSRLQTVPLPQLLEVLYDMRDRGLVRSRVACAKPKDEMPVLLWSQAYPAEAAA